ncbi:MAG: hypothetical protein ACREU3_05895, partial [Steroidobacteraceae bacterium]
HLLVFFFAMGTPLTGPILPTCRWGPVNHPTARRQTLRGGGGQENKTFEIMSAEEDGPEAAKKISPVSKF